VTSVSNRMEWMALPIEKLELLDRADGEMYKDKAASRVRGQPQHSVERRAGVGMCILRDARKLSRDYSPIFRLPCIPLWPPSQANVQPPFLGHLSKPIPPLKSHLNLSLFQS
jgi:hypothetical protein